MMRTMLALTMLACGHGGEERPVAGLRVAVEPVRREVAEAEVLVSGELQAWERVVLQPRVTGFVHDRRIELGDRVRRGDVLFVLTAPEREAERARAVADLRGAEARLARLRQASAAEGSVAKGQLETAEHEVDALSAHARALAALAAELTVKAPFDGVVTRRGADLGALVGPGQPPLGEVAQVDRLRLELSVPEAHVASLAVGAPVTFAVEAWPGERFEGTLGRLAHSVDRISRTMRVEVDVDNALGRLAPGMYAEVRLPVRRAEASWLVPATAVTRTTEGRFVIAVRDDAVVRIPVRLGHEIGASVEVFGELRTDDRVAVRGSEDLVPGAAVVAVAARADER